MSEKLRGILVQVGKYDIRWRYFFAGLLGTLIFLLIQNWSMLAGSLPSLDWVLIKDYFAILLTWPTTVLTLGLFFIIKFSASIRVFLEKIDRMKALGVELSQQQSKMDTLHPEDPEQKAVQSLESEAGNGSVTLTKERVDQLLGVFEDMEFRFLNLHLVQNTKNALRMIAHIDVQKNAFIQIYQVPEYARDPVEERRAILNELLTAGLAIDDDGILRVTEKGTRFLQFVGLG